MKMISSNSGLKTSCECHHAYQWQATTIINIFFFLFGNMNMLQKSIVDEKFYASHYREISRFSST
jgi:hypothetical protein